MTESTDRGKAERAQSRLAAIVDSAEDAIIGKDLHGIITDWNRGAERLFGYTAAEAIGCPISMLIPDDRVDEEPGILRRIRLGESVDPYETVRRHKNGSRLHISLSVSPIVDSQGRVVGASKIARDISERIRMEDALRDADRRKDEFLATLSHELRNPLAAICNSVQLLRMDPGPTMRRTVLEPLERQLGILTRLVDDLMDVSRVTTGRITLRRETVELGQLMRDAADSVMGEMAERKHAFTVTALDTRLPVLGDRTRLEQVVVNLLTNAAKYTPDGGCIDMSAERDGNEAVLRVRDSGIGIRQDLLPEIFGLFSQAAVTLDRSRGGLGIGLALVRHLVQMHGGSVSAMSEGSGTGSEFVVRLPALDAAVDLQGDEPTGVQAEVAGTQDATRALRVLVVDDNRDSADMQTTLLKCNGYDVRTAYDGRQALVVAVEFQPDVLLLDIGLPEIDGYEVAFRIRQQEALADIPMIAMTGYGQPEDKRRSEAAGFDHHLVKPVEFAELQGILAACRPRALAEQR